jgi:hypothetical protein
LRSTAAGSNGWILLIESARCDGARNPMRAPHFFHSQGN